MSTVEFLLSGSIGGAVIVGILFVFWRIAQSRKRQNVQQDIQQALQSVMTTMTTQIATLTEAMDRRIAENTTQLNMRLSDTAQSIAKVQQAINIQLADNTKRIDQRMDATAQSFAHVKALLAKVEASNQRMVEVSKDVASLQDILTAPKLRGGFGELMLADLLESMLPQEHYAIQYRFSNGDIVDAIIKLRDNTLISVDAKFPLENFKRVMAGDLSENDRARARRAFVSDVKKHVQAIAKKYIVPEEGTLEFALMYIPAENVYYETIIADKDGHDLLEYFFKHRVIPVSPNSFYAYLMTIVFGLRGLRIEKQARAMIGAIDRLAREHERFGDDFDKLGRHIGNAQKKYEDADKRFGRIATQVERIKGQHGATTIDVNDAMITETLKE